MRPTGQTWRIWEYGLASVIQAQPCQPALVSGKRYPRPRRPARRRRYNKNKPANQRTQKGDLMIIALLLRVPYWNASVMTISLATGGQTSQHRTQPEQCAVSNKRLPRSSAVCSLMSSPPTCTTSHSMHSVASSLSGTKQPVKLETPRRASQTAMNRIARSPCRPPGLARDCYMRRSGGSRLRPARTSAAALLQQKSSRHGAAANKHSALLSYVLSAATTALPGQPLLQCCVKV